MKTGNHKPDRGIAIILATACIAMAILATSCGGGAGSGATADPASTTGLSVSPPTVTFGNQAVGTSSAAQTNIVTNVGNSTVNISSITLAGTNPSDFAESNNCGATLAAGANCTITVTFQPTAVGTLTAEVTVTDNVSHSPHKVGVNGTGTASAASLSPTSLTFASQTVGATSAAQTITLSNSGDAALSVTSITVSGANASDFAETNNCGSSVAASANCKISVTFKPAAAGARTAAVTVTDNASGSPQSVSLSGTGGSTSAAASVSPASLSFGSEAVDMVSTSQVVTLSNTGSASLSISIIAFTGADAGDFTEVDTCSPAVAAGGTCTIAILFTPAASGARTAALSIADNASGSPQSVSLSGSGTHDVMLSWSASSTPGVMGYNVFRGTTSGGESATPLNSAPVCNTTFADANVTAGATYYYHVTAIAANDVTQSSASNETSATVPTP